MTISTPKSSSSLSLNPHLFPLFPSLSSSLQPKKSLHFRRHTSFSSSSNSPSSEPRRVSTAPVPQSPAPGLNFPKEISRLQFLISRLRNANSLREKLEVLNTDSRVREFFRSSRDLPSLDVKDEFLVKSLVAAGQAHVLGPEMRRGGGGVGRGGLREALFVLAGMVARWGGDGVGSGGTRGKFGKLVEVLNDVEEFYDCVGGIIG